MEGVGIEHCGKVNIVYRRKYITIEPLNSVHFHYEQNKAYKIN